jgi:hypothetical protein
MRERAMLIGARLRLDGDRGTTVVLRVPRPRMDGRSDATPMTV